MVMGPVYIRRVCGGSADLTKNSTFSIFSALFRVVEYFGHPPRMIMYKD